LRLVATLRVRFGRRLRELRVQKGYNQLYLATLASVSEDFLSLVERGISAPSFETIEALALALDTDVTALFTFPGEEGERQRVRMLKGKKRAENSRGRMAEKVAGKPAKKDAPTRTLKGR
jgi:transcriptional regulator with XRE-family HTH domain